MKPHSLRLASNILHAIAMALPTPIGRPIARRASRYYYRAIVESLRPHIAASAAR